MKHTHGGNIYDYKNIKYDFSTNINPMGMPRQVEETIKSSVHQMMEYPDIRGRELRQQIAFHEGVFSSDVVLGNGAGELIYALCNGIRPEGCLMLAPTFSEYEAALQVFDCNVSWINLKEENEFRVTRIEMNELFTWIRQTKGRRMIFFCNPNNPTGVVVNRQLMLRIADVCQQAGVYLCVDECFLPFLKEEGEYSLKTEVNAYSYLIVLRAFTKFYGMAGLRLGYVLTSNRQLVERLYQVLPPWNTSVMAQLAGVVALQDEDYKRQTRNLVEEERNYLMTELRNNLVEKVYPSSANYILLKAERGLQEKLLSSGILIRNCNNYRNLIDGYYRIAVKKHEANEALVNAMKKRLL